MPTNILPVLHTISLSTLRRMLCAAVTNWATGAPP